MTVSIQEGKEHNLLQRLHIIRLGDQRHSLILKWGHLHGANRFDEKRWLSDIIKHGIMLTNAFKFQSAISCITLIPF